MKRKTCTSCAGTGYSIAVKFGGHLERNYNSICDTCGGNGHVNDYSYTPTTNKNSSRVTSSGSNSNKVPTKTVAKTSDSNLTMNDFFMVIGFILGGIVAYQASANWIAAVVAGLITGVILRITYKLIFAVFVILIILHFVLQP